MKGLIIDTKKIHAPKRNVVKRLNTDAKNPAFSSLSISLIEDNPHAWLKMPVMTFISDGILEAAVYTPKADAPMSHSIMILSEECTTHHETVLKISGNE